MAPPHIAERYGLRAIITLGEGVIGTVASVGAVVAEHGWSTEAVLVVVAGIGLTFAMWWLYFAVPFGDLLHRHRERSFLFGYGHLPVFMAIAAVGAGLHVAAYVVEGKAKIGDTTAVASVAMPVMVFFRDRVRPAQRDVGTLGRLGDGHRPGHPGGAGAVHFLDQRRSVDGALSGGRDAGADDLGGRFRGDPPEPP